MIQETRSGRFVDYQRHARLVSQEAAHLTARAARQNVEINNGNHKMLKSTRRS